MICKEMVKINGCFVNKNLTRNVLDQLANNTINLYNEFIESYSMNNISEEGKLQLYSDMRFFIKLFEGYWNTYKKDEQNNLFKQLIRKIISSIDPINFAYFEKNINSNIDNYYYRVNILLGVLLIFNQQSSESKLNINIERFNTISLAPQCQRFSIFPVINISNNETFNEKNNIIIGSDMKSQQKINGIGSKGQTMNERPKIQVLKNISSINDSNSSTESISSKPNSSVNNSNLISSISSSVTDNANSWAQSLTSSFFGWASPDPSRRTYNRK